MRDLSDDDLAFLATREPRYMTWRTGGGYFLPIAPEWARRLVAEVVRLRAELAARDARDADRALDRRFE
jgi:hypothetical protein